MTLSNKKIELSCDYLSAAFVCLAIILSGDSRIVIGLVCTVCHEIGHIVVMLKYGCEKIEVKINLFNIEIIDRKRGFRPYFQDFAVVFAGPFVNFAMMIVFGLMNFFFDNELFWNISVLSGVLCGFNMLPVSTTDGGQLLEIVLLREMPPGAVCSIINVLTVVLSVPLFGLGVFVLINSKYNFTLLMSGLYLLFVNMKDRGA